MIPFLPDVSVPPSPVTLNSVNPGPVTPGGAAPGLITQPGAALRGGPNTAGAGLDFAGLLNAALPEGESAAPAHTNLPASLPGLGLRASASVTPPPALPGQPASLRAVPQPPAPATSLTPGTILPEGGGSVPQPDTPVAAPVAVLGDEAPTEAPIIAPETNPAPIIAVHLPANTAGAQQEQPEPISLADSEDVDEASPLPAAPIPVAVPVVIIAATPPSAPPTPARAAIRTDEPRAGPPIRAEHRAQSTPTPAHIALPQAESEADPAPSAILAEALPSSAAPNAPQPAPATTPLAPQPAIAPAMAEHVEPRSPAADQESAIAQVGELREALRAARPEMTLRHAEFGNVSLRIEPTAGQDWRAVLASRDPGFVPAIHAALAERAVAATADTAGTGANAGQNGTSDQRYGSSPNGGQGSSQPYLSQYGGQSGGREEGQSSHQQNRQPSTTDAVVARAGDADAQRPDRSERGVFA